MQWKRFRGFSPIFVENFKISLRSLKSNKLRSFLTIAMIAIGIVALVGILTAIEAVNKEVLGTFSKMGANSFVVSSKYSFDKNNFGQRIRNRKEISYAQAKLFYDNYNFPAIKTVYSNLLSYQTISSGSEKTSPTVDVIGVDVHYLEYRAIELSQGRNFSNADLERGLSVCILGSGIYKTLFKNTNSEADNIISIGAKRYKVVGLIKELGAGPVSSMDMNVLLPITTARSQYVNNKTDFEIGVISKDVGQIDQAMAEAEQVFRSVRRLAPMDASDFVIEKSDALYEDMKKMISYLTIGSLVVGLITLLGATVGLMNIMLVSVKERINEIGTRDRKSTRLNSSHL